jgi:diguanylate cyclase (GGDEF)-like protein
MGNHGNALKLSLDFSENLADLAGAPSVERCVDWARVVLRDLLDGKVTYDPTGISNGDNYTQIFADGITIDLPDHRGRFTISNHDVPFVDRADLIEILNANAVALSEYLRASEKKSGLVDLVRDYQKRTLSEIKRSSDLEKSEATARDLAYKDGLTNLYNRRFFDETIERLHESAARGNAYALVMLDLDHFKAVNDTYGHPIGDVVLSSVSEVIRSSVRGSDIACRYGGEEFAVLLQNATEQDAYELAERVKQGIASLVISTGKSDRSTINPTASLGVSDYQEDDVIVQVIGKADKALYQAKETGRNKVVSASEL